MSSLRVYVTFEEKLSESLEFIDAAHLLVKLRVDNQVKVVVDLIQLSNVFILHLSTSSALSARVISLWEADLINDNIVNIDLKFGKFNSEALSLIK